MHQPHDFAVFCTPPFASSVFLGDKSSQVQAPTSAAPAVVSSELNMPAHLHEGIAQLFVYTSEDTSEEGEEERHHQCTAIGYRFNEMNGQVTTRDQRAVSPASTLFPSSQ